MNMVNSDLQAGLDVMSPCTCLRVLKGLQGSGFINTKMSWPNDATDLDPQIRTRRVPGKQASGQFPSLVGLLWPMVSHDSELLGFPSLDISTPHKRAMDTPHQKAPTARAP